MSLAGRHFSLSRGPHYAAQVSPTYAREVSGHGAIAPHVGKFHGIRNGIDADIWDPLGDDFLPVSARHHQPDRTGTLHSSDEFSDTIFKQSFRLTSDVPATSLGCF